jgi:hypothetical protein
MRGAKLKSHSHRESTQGESWKTALDLIKLGQKTARQKDNAPEIRKSNLLFLRVIVKNEFTDDDDIDGEGEPVKPITSPCDSVSGY